MRRVGKCYGRRSAREYNKVKALAAEREEGRPVVLRHFARLLENDDFIRQFCVVNGYLDPGMTVQTRAPDGTWQKWMRIEEDGLSCFCAPDGYAGGAIFWFHDTRFLEESMVFESTKTFVEVGRA